jgi:hypothetical protein
MLTVTDQCFWALAKVTTTEEPSLFHLLREVERRHQRIIHKIQTETGQIQTSLEILSAFRKKI